MADGGVWTKIYPDVASLGGGKVLQVIQPTPHAGYKSTTSQTYQDIGPGLEVSITPKDASSKILVMVSLAANTGYAQQQSWYGLNRDGTIIAECRSQSKSDDLSSTNAIILLDAPATTSAVLYKVQIKAGSAGHTAHIDSLTSTLTVMEVAA